MKIEDLNIRELFDFDPENGMVRFASQRAVIIDATAIGSLRKELVEHFGVTVARGLLTRFGYVHGWRMAEAVRDHFKWDDEDQRHRAGAHIPMFEGMYCLQPETSGPMSVAGLVLASSFEAEQHVAHLGRSDVAVCWTICGLLSGYLSRTTDLEIFVLEENCIGRGDAACHLLGRTRKAWGNERSAELEFFHLENLDQWLDSSLHLVTTSLKTVEKKLRERMRVLARILPDIDETTGIIARSPTMHRVVDLARRVAMVDSTVLITGESGTGKELIARFVHEQSARARGPFVAINCGAITDSLLESELFGHARGSFSGAVRDRIGLFEAANGGTILLDEIGEVSMAMQVKLLRVLQEREIRRIGENQSRPIEVRVIAATNSELTKAIAASTFRMDLYYRLNVVELHVPPLRERHDDILPLARILLANAAKRFKRPITGLSPRAADQLLRYSWPGNVRELENAMERAVALSRVKRLEFEDLPEEVRQAIAIPALTGSIRSLGDVEKEYILSVLARNDGNQTQTADVLGIGTATLYRKLKSYGVGAGKRGPSKGPPPAAD